MKRWRAKMTKIELALVDSEIKNAGFKKRVDFIIELIFETNKRDNEKSRKQEQERQATRDQLEEGKSISFEEVQRLMSLQRNQLLKKNQPMLQMEQVIKEGRTQIALGMMHNMAPVVDDRREIVMKKQEEQEYWENGMFERKKNFLISRILETRMMNRIIGHNDEDNPELKSLFEEFKRLIEARKLYLTSSPS